VTVAVSQPMLDLDADSCEGIDELLSRESLGRMGKEHFGNPRVAGHIVILKDKLTTLTENASDLLQCISPVRDVVNGRELSHSIKARIWLVDCAGIAGPDLDLAGSVAESPPRPANHLVIHVDCDDLAGSEAIEKKLDTDALAASNLKHAPSCKRLHMFGHCVCYPAPQLTNSGRAVDEPRLS
jgi:hypothetical protein